MFEHENDLLQELINLGAEKLGAHLDALKRKEHEVAHYFKGSFQSLKEAAQKLFGLDSSEFRALCLDKITENGGLCDEAY